MSVYINHSMKHGSAKLPLRLMASAVAEFARIQMVFQFWAEFLRIQLQDLSWAKPLSLTAEGGCATNRCATKRYATKRGMVLVVVLIVVFMISLAGLSFVMLMATENKAVHLRGKELQAQCLLGSGEAAMAAFIERSKNRGRSGDGLVESMAGTDGDEYFRGVLVLGDERSDEGGRFSVLAPRIEDGQIVGTRFGIANESARLNLGALPDWERRIPGSARKALLSLPGMTEEVADAILDWIDADDQPREQGAESQYYRELGVPYLPRGAAPGCVEELLLVKGVTRTLLLGADMNYNYTVEPQEKQLAAGDAQAAQDNQESLPWASLLTVYSAERNLQPDGKPRINLNSKNLAKLHERLKQVFESRLADFIVLYRQYGPLDEKKKNASTPVTDAAESGKKPKIDFKQPAKFHFKTILDLVDAEIELPPDKNQKTPDPSKTSSSDDKNKPVRLKSPLGNEPASLNETLPKLLDFATVFPGKVITGRVNINLAPQSVLEGIPGLEGASAVSIVAARGSQEGSQAGPQADDEERRHATWLLRQGLLDLAQMKAIMPFVTGGGDVYRAQIVGFFDRAEPVIARGPIARAELVLDATGDHPRRVYWKDLRIMGPGFTPSSLGAVHAVESELSSDLVEQK